MNYLYLTADAIGTPSGGGRVTYEESEALKTLGPCAVWGREQLQCLEGRDPWGWDEYACCQLVGCTIIPLPGLVHIYAGTWPNTVAFLKSRGCKVAVTVAAHDREVSRREHEKWGIDFAGCYPHLTRADLWQKYIAGYALADVIVCPSHIAANTVRNYGPEFGGKRIEVVPHGVDLPGRIAPLPERFTVGYLGAIGPDKGLIYLLQAWRKLNYKDAVLLIGGRGSASVHMRGMLSQFGGGNVICVGWVDNISDFYNKLSLYIQPSATEGFGIEVLEAMAHGRPVLCSTGAGAQDVVPWAYQFSPCNSDELASAINTYKKLDWQAESPGWRQAAEEYTWPKIRQRYIDLWKSM